MSLVRKVRVSRRDLLKQTGVISAFGAASAIAPSVASATMLAAEGGQHKLPDHQGTAEDNLFTRIGVRPMINGRGTFTIISGSRSLPEVKQAMYDASFYFVHLDEMMDGIGAQLGKLMGAEWGIATTGCEAAICLATVACMVGTNVEQSQSLPYIKKKDQVIIPKTSRNQYDFGVRMVGAEIVEVETIDEVAAKISPRTAMIYIMSNPGNASGPMSIKNICAVAKQKGVPVFVDAAAEEPISPNIHIQNGATLVGYSGGKCLRGPQSSGIMLGQKDLCKAAYFQAAPHHNYGRAFKCSKEEAMGILAAVQTWYKRDHAAEQKMWRVWLKTIEDRMKGLPSVTCTYHEPEDLSNHAPTLEVAWDANVLKITGTELSARLYEGTPRIAIGGARGKRPEMMQSSITVMPYMMDAGDEKIIADTVYKALTNPGHYENPVIPTGTPEKVEGDWAVTIHYPRGTGEQKFTLRQNGNDITGNHIGEIYKAPMKGSIHADQLELTSGMAVGGNTIHWTFKGKVEGNEASGSVNMGEYGDATWKAIRA
ncbi:MAG: PLP-dependent transferase [Edaphobacter sp.]|uniref:PLP-dependent transferase n=1 Tax=Edaphobacter sp. TaxID=1934404 RepID=UPI002386567E|nr:PLP-dependent transferase [Edaphobacter sp.]MDE1177286.1 PLP-dependent transferase [Edaphobacter sp.]